MKNRVSKEWRTAKLKNYELAKKNDEEVDPMDIDTK